MKAVTFICILMTAFLLISSAAAQEDTSVDMEGPVLIQAAMCEKIEGLKPVNPAIVFSIDLGRIYCFSAFKQIPDTLFIYHKWFQNDRLVSRKRLTLKPPTWSTISSMQLRMADRGPWYVEITDDADILYQRLRFSISD